MKYVVIKTGGKQYKATKDSVIEVERVGSKQGEKFNINDVLLHVADGKIKLGRPMIKGMAVRAEVVEHFKGEKLRIAKFKAKAKYRRTTGHRQYLSKIKILDILTAVKN